MVDALCCQGGVEDYVKSINRFQIVRASRQRHFIVLMHRIFKVALQNNNYN